MSVRGIGGSSGRMAALEPNDALDRAAVDPTRNRGPAASGQSTDQPDTVAPPVRGSQKAQATQPTPGPTTTHLELRRNPLDGRVPTPEEARAALLELPAAAFAPLVEELWQLAEAQGHIDAQGRAHVLRAEIPNRFLHALCACASFDLALGATREQLARVLAKALCAVSWQWPPAGTTWSSLAAQLPAPALVLLRHGLEHLGVPSSTAARLTTPAAGGAGFVPSLTADEWRTGLGFAKDALIIDVIAERLLAFLEGDASHARSDPLLRLLCDQAREVGRDLKAELTLDTKDGLIATLAEVLGKHYCEADGSLPACGMFTPGRRPNLMTVHTLAEPLYGELSACRNGPRPNAAEAHRAFERELAPVAHVIAAAEGCSAEHSRRSLLRSVAITANDGPGPDLWLPAELALGLPSDIPSLEAWLTPRLKAWNDDLRAIPEQCEMLDRVAARIPDGAFSGHLLLFVQHLLGTKVALLNVLRAKGIATADILAVGLPYSSCGQVELKLRARKIDTQVIRALDELRDRLRDAVAQMIERSRETGQPILVIDDGGTVMELIQAYFPEEAWRFRLVELTARGITAAQAAIAKGGFVPPGDVSVGGSIAKGLEGPWIAQGGLDVIDDLLATRGAWLAALGEEEGPRGLDGAGLCVFGLGRVGLATAREGQKRGATVYAWDKSREARERARALGVAVPERRSRFVRLFAHTDVVLGCSGFPSIEARDLPAMRPHTLVASLSSKRVEFDDAAKYYLMLPGLTQVKDLGIFLRRHALGTPEQLARPNNHKLVELYFGQPPKPGPIIVNDQQPINFEHKVFAVPAEYIQFTESALLDAAYQAVSEPDASGVVTWRPKRQLALVLDWREVNPDRDDPNEIQASLAAERALRDLIAASEAP